MIRIVKTVVNTEADNLPEGTIVEWDPDADIPAGWDVFVPE